jgi:uncharacterized membrane protein AbrB (regulator of aidB expression)
LAGIPACGTAWLGSVAVGTVGLMVVCAGFAWLLHWATGLPWVTLVLGTPGGIAEMAITAKVLQLGCRWSPPSRCAA